MPDVAKLISPIDGSVYAETPFVTAAQAEAAITGAREAQRTWREVPLEMRVHLVMSAIAALRAVDDEVVPELAWVMGRPVRYGGEIAGVEERTKHMAAIAADSLAPLVVENSNSSLRQIGREPLGLVLVIAPWNYPYLTAINTIAPALIAGNAVILKHAPQTALVGERFAHAFAAAHLPNGVFTNLLMDHATIDALIAAGRFDFVNFTGSVAGGRAIEQAAAGTFTATALELGGKDAGYVMDDADLDAAVASLIDGAMFNSGQCCCGIERIYVVRPLFKSFVDKAVALVESYRLDNPIKQDTTLGPMAHKRFADEVRAQTSEAIAQGARACLDSRRFGDDGGTYVAPQILTCVSHHMRIMRDETFGPVVGIMPVGSDAEAIERINDATFGLTASLWTNDVARASAAAAQLETGTVFMNRCDYVDPGLAWTGRKSSGRGAALSPLGYLNLTRPKSYHFRKQP